MTEFEFVDDLPGYGGKGPSKDAPAAEACRANPGRWLVLREETRRQVADQLAVNIRRGQRAAFRGPGWEAAVRTVDGVSRVYIRWTEGSR